MSNKIFILAPSGTGKSSSLRNLDPKRTGIINCDKKELPLRGWRKNYVTERVGGTVDLNNSNYIATSQPENVENILRTWNISPNLDTIVIDTITHMITNDYMNNTIGKDFKAYQKLGKNFYNIIQQIVSSKKNVIVFGHIEKTVSPNGDVVFDMKSHGKMISDLVPASYFTCVLMGLKRKSTTEPGKFDYLFRTQSEGEDPAKSPAYFENDVPVTALELYEPNDVKLILDKLEKFETTV